MNNSHIGTASTIGNLVSGTARAGREYLLFRGKIRKPRDPKGKRTTIWFRTLVLLVGIIPISIVFGLASLITGSIYSVWTFFISLWPALAIVLWGEAFRRSAIVRLQEMSDGDLEFEVSTAGFKFTEVSEFRETLRSDLKASGFSQKVYRSFFKRLFDAIMVILAAPLIISIVGVLAVLIFVEDRVNPFYRQSRVGRNGRIFTIWKLRTMVPNADVVLQNYLLSNPEASKEWNKFQRLKRDPRVTRIGRFLRYLSLDELPQLWSVLKGDMSAVGPRPLMVEQRRHFDLPNEYFTVRPGVTGLWQIYGDGDFLDRIEYDKLYVKHLSFALDVKIMLRTIEIFFGDTESH